jgi:hypothetical protein
VQRFRCTGHSFFSDSKMDIMDTEIDQVNDT